MQYAWKFNWVKRKDRVSNFSTRLSFLQLPISQWVEIDFEFAKQISKDEKKNDIETSKIILTHCVHTYLVLIMFLKCRWTFVTRCPNSRTSHSVIGLTNEQRFFNG